MYRYLPKFRPHQYQLHLSQPNVYLEKEFDLSMKEVNDFIDWYEAKQSGTGTASYAINKHDNNKGPFTSRKDYILFDRVLTFEVSEYNQ